MRKLVLVPEEPAYRLRFGDNNLATGNDSGAMRLRHRLRGNPHVADVSWSVTGLEFDYIRAFWRSVTKFGAMPFLIDLPVRGHVPVEHKALFVPGSFSINGEGPLLYTVSAQLLVVPS